MQTEKLKSVWNKYKTIIVSVVAVVLSLGFVGSMLGAVFSGGELIEKVETEKARGLLQLDNAAYATGYLVGDTFWFDTENSKVALIAKDPLIDHIVKINDLPQSEYGFRTVRESDGEDVLGELVNDPSDIVLDKSVKAVEVVSKKYPDIKTPIDVTVSGRLNPEAKFFAEMLIEAEKTNLYRDGELLTEEQKKTQPDPDKPFLSSAGSAGNIKGTDCSGGACIRNFSSGMQFEFELVCSERTNVSLEILVCKRPQATLFDNGFVTKLNGFDIKTDATIPEGGSGSYFTPYSFTVTVMLQRGYNVLTFDYGKSNPVNFDAVKFVSLDGNAIFGGLDALVNE